MKTIINKSTKITEQISSDPTIELRTLNYADLALLTLNIPPERGWTTAEMRIRLKVEDKLEDVEVEAEVNLEDAEFAKLLECSNLKWSFKHKDILAYCDHLEEVSKK